MELNKIYKGNSLEILKQFPDNSVDCCVTSPPYYGLRNYDEKEQIGLEKTPQEYIIKLVKVFTEVYRILKPQGTIWINIGDSYAGSGKGSATHPKTNHKYMQNNNKGTHQLTVHNFKTDKIKPKDLIGIPWMLAFALRESGWYLRQEIIWSKNNPMPESVKDRCTKAHEQLFLLTKRKKYYFDAEAIKTISKTPKDDRGKRGNKKRTPTQLVNGIRNTGVYEKANKRSVWTENTQSFKEAHFATFPEKLIVDCILAGCPENGIVLDPFMGSGTTALVAKKKNRNYIGIDLNQTYIDIAEKRLKKELGIFQ